MSNNVVFDTLASSIPGFNRRPSGTWNSFNAVCCIHNGETRPDTRGRGGLMLTSDDICVYHCFNCKYKTSWRPGNQLHANIENLLNWANVPSEDIKKLKFNAWRQWVNRDIKYTENLKPSVNLRFKKVDLPKGAQPFTHWLQQDPLAPEFINALEYIMDRDEKLIEEYPFYWTDDKHFNINHRVIIPFLWDNEIVGFTARDVSGKAKQRYFSSVPPNYIFNTHIIQEEHKYIFVCEGPFDAMAINGIALLGDKMTPEQAEWLNNTGKKIVVVPDREKGGGSLVDWAIKNNWYVSFPIWGDDKTSIKDAADAVKQYGKIYTVASILDKITNDRMSIHVQRNLKL